MADGMCADIDPRCCVDQGGIPLGLGSACEGDNNGDGTDDACKPARPMPDADFGLKAGRQVVPCAVHEDCLLNGMLDPDSQVQCVPPPAGDAGLGTCYVKRNRYVATDPNPNNNGRRTARRVCLDDDNNGVCDNPANNVLGWVGAPMTISVTSGNSGAPPEPTLQLLARLVEEVDRHYRDWSVDDGGQPWVDATLHVSDCEVSPEHTYVIQAILEGQSITNEGNYSEALVLGTVLDYGDVRGTPNPSPPDRIRSFRDINQVLAGFQSRQTHPKSWLDLQGPNTAPLCPTFAGGGVDFLDVNKAVAGFQGGTYLVGPPPNFFPTGFFLPLDCPVNVCL